jgi:hypothetical protein
MTTNFVHIHFGKVFSRVINGLTYTEKNNLLSQRKILFVIQPTESGSPNRLIKSIRRTTFGRLDHKLNFPLGQQIIFFGVGVHRNFPHIFLGISKAWVTNIFGIWTNIFFRTISICLIFEFKVPSSKPMLKPFLISFLFFKFQYF